MKQLEDITYSTFFGKPCMTYHHDSNYQVFETEDGNFVYDKNKKVVYKFEKVAFDRLLLKLTMFMKEPEIKDFNYALYNLRKNTSTKLADEFQAKLNKMN